LRRILKRGVKPLFFLAMKLEETIKSLVEVFLDRSPLFLVEVEILNGNKKIMVTIDGDKGVGIDDCARVSRYLEKELESDERLQQFFQLEVGSPGAEEPLKLPRQFHKHTGRIMKVKTRDGEIVKGRLKESDSTHLLLEEKEKKKEALIHRIEMNDIIEALVVLEF